MVGYYSIGELEERSSTQCLQKGVGAGVIRFGIVKMRLERAECPLPGATPYSSSSSVRFLHILLPLEFMLKRGFLMGAFSSGALGSAPLMGKLLVFAWSYLMFSKPQKLSLQDSFPYIFFLRLFKDRKQPPFSV